MFSLSNPGFLGTSTPKERAGPPVSDPSWPCWHHFLILASRPPAADPKFGEKPRQRRSHRLTKLGPRSSLPKQQRELDVESMRRALT
jgi:hypothetical protein